MCNRNAFYILAASIILSISGDILFHNSVRVGVNLPIWITLFICVGNRLAFRLKDTTPNDQIIIDKQYRTLIFAGITLLFACLLCYRSSVMLQLFDKSAVLIGLILTVTSINNPMIFKAGSISLVSTLLKSIGRCIVGGSRILPQLHCDTSQLPILFIIGRILRGILLACIPVSIFGILLINADAVYGHFIAKLFNWDIPDLLAQLCNIIIFAWLLLGIYWFTCSHRIKKTSESGPKTQLTWTDITAILGLVDLLFITFVIVQIRYLFGGSYLVKNIVGMTYSQYARQGFFELVWVSAIVTPLLLLLHWLRDSDRRTILIFKILCAIQIALVFVIMASAVVRMLAYTHQYGLTELRFYPLVFMIWLSLVLVLFAFTVLRDKRQYFTCGAIFNAFIVAAIVHIINPDSLITHINTDRAFHGKSFDACYVGSLSDDAIPELTKALPKLNSVDRSIVAYQINSRTLPKKLDWRAWNYGDTTARSIITTKQTELKALSVNIQKDPCFNPEDVD